MNKKLISMILLCSFLLASCSLMPKNEETSEETTTEETTSESSEDTTQTSGTTAYLAAEDADDMFRYLSAGDTFTFGEYDGEELEWIVLSISGYTCYCITADIVEVMAMNETGGVNDWNTTTTCIWLNEEFYEEAFTDEEKVRIRYAAGTEGPVVDPDNKIYVATRYDIERYGDILATHPVHEDWWLRSHPNGTTNIKSDLCHPDGTVYDGGDNVLNEHGIRPVMKLYIGTDPDTLDLANLTPTPTPTPSPSPTPSPTPTPAPEPEPATAVVPSEMSYDASISEEANLETYYTNNIAGLYGQAPSVPATTGERDFLPYGESWLDIPGALAHSIADFDGDGDLEMIAFVFVAELDEEEIENSDRICYRMHLILCDDIDGSVRMIQDLPVESWYMDRDGQYQTSMYSYHSCICSDTLFQLNISIYQIERDGKPCILMTEETSAFPVGDGFTEACYIFEVNDNTIMYASTYSAFGGSDDTHADEITFENGEPVSCDTYYMYPDYYDAPGMYQGVGYYLDRQGLANADYENHYGTQVTDTAAPLIAEVSVVPVMSVEGQYSGPWTINYEVQIG